MYFASLNSLSCLHKGTCTIAVQTEEMAATPCSIAWGALLDPEIREEFTAGKSLEFLWQCYCYTQPASNREKMGCEGSEIHHFTNNEKECYRQVQLYVPAG